MCTQPSLLSLCGLHYLLHRHKPSTKRQFHATKQLFLKMVQANYFRGRSTGVNPYLCLVQLPVRDIPLKYQLNHHQSSSHLQRPVVIRTNELIGHLLYSSIHRVLLKLVFQGGA